MHTQLLLWAESCVGISAARCRIPLAISVAIATLSLNVTVLCAQTYTLTDIGTLGGSESNGGGINSSGQVTGASTIAGSSLPHAFVYTPGVSPTMIDIMPAAPNTLSSSWGASINDAGQVTGVWNETAFVYLPRPFSLMVPLPMPPHTGQSYGTSINSSGQIVGYYCAIGFLGGCEHTVFLFNSGAPSAVIQAVATPGSGYGVGFGINDAGQITGLFYTSDSSTSQTHAFLSNPSHIAGASPTMSDLGTLPNGSYAEGFAINSFGQVTGWAGISNTSAAGHAFLYSNGSPIYSTPGIIDLGTPPGGGTSLGMGINNLDQVTGWFLTDTDAHRAFLFINNGMSDLNSLIDPSTPLPANVTLVQGDAINNNGWIVADGTNSVTGVTHAFLLRPSPATTPTCKPQGNFTVCTLRPTICGSNGFPFCAAACAFPGCVSSLVNWTPPLLGGGDPWLDGVSANTLTTTWEQARSVATGLQVVVSTQPQTQSIAERNTSAELIDGGAVKLHSVSVVGSLVDFSAARDAAPAARILTGSKTDRAIELSLPYDVASVTVGTNIRMVEFDRTKGHWVDIGDQYVTVSKHIVTARVSAVGRFTVVAETPKAQRGSLPRPSVGSEMDLKP